MKSELRERRKETAIRESDIAKSMCSMSKSPTHQWTRKKVVDE